VSAVSVSYLGIPGYLIFWAFFTLALGLFSRRVYFLLRLARLGRAENRFDNMGHRLMSVLTQTLSQWCSLKNISLHPPDLAGMGHAFLFFGFSLFLIGYIIFIGLAGGFGLAPVIAGTTFELVYSSILDLAALLVITAVIWAAIRRYVLKPARLKEETTAEAGIILLLVFSLMVLHILTEGFSYAATGIAGYLPPLGAALAKLLAGAGISQGVLAASHQWVWWLHYVTILGFLVFIPYSKHLHLLASFPNIAFRNLEPKGALKPIDLEQAETLGATGIQDFTWKDLLDLYTCTRCGRCQDSCPATTSGKPLNPKQVIQNMKQHLLAAGPGLLKASAKAGASSPPSITGEVIAEDEIWACTTCRTCQEVCPVSIEPMTKLIDLRRNLVMEQATMPETAEVALRSIEDRGHPWRGTTASRTDWAEGLNIKTLAEDSHIDILYWVGCTEALEERSTKVARSVARLLKLAGVNFAILGAEESCCGEPARRLGNEYLFQTQVAKNIEILKSYNVKRIVTACPHCYNTLKNEYPQFGGEFEVSHHTQFIAELFQKNRLRAIKGLGGMVTYQDPCYLGRYNDIYQPPRQILSHLPDLTAVEMKPNKTKSFCCGGGGGRMWLEEAAGQRVSELRLEQAMATQASVIATACPYCLQMLDDAIKTREVTESLKVKDIAELIAEAALYRPYPEASD